MQLVFQGFRVKKKVMIQLFRSSSGSSALVQVDYLEFCNLLGKCPKRDPMMLAAMTRTG